MVTPERVPAPPSNEPGGDGSEPDVVVIAVTYNAADIIEAFLRALPDALRGIDSTAVTIVDNASIDGTAELVEAIAPWVRLVRSDANLGYAGGINLGYARGLGTRGTYILNPDAVPAVGSVRVLLDVIEADPTVGVVVPRIQNAQGGLKFSLRREPTLLRAVGETVLGGHRAARFAPLGDMIRDPAAYHEGATADWATGAAMFLSRRAIDEVGLWDEQFFLYSEETDYALRMRDLGYHLHFTPRATVQHPGGDMSRSPYLWSLVATSRMRLYRKRHDPLRSASYWLVQVINEGARASLGRPTHRAAFRALMGIGGDPREDRPDPRVQTVSDA
ncbi:glycosyltransferase family 2 protein [Occultella glacieicola]|uniref:glycosyltransferase family 2 protein n=1 Tax=Occultella glacieicola TaxID=2518684 RepID=UPI001404AC0D|nr:glycosyltransferase family 2 protein [Occultella glacieicola]